MRPPQTETSCQECGKVGLNWRPYQSYPEIKCSACLKAKHVPKTDSRPSWWVPAVPVPDAPGTYYGYLSIPFSTTDWVYD